MEGLLPAELETIFGLPTSDYTWGEGGGGGDDLNASRMATNELRYLMREFDSYHPNVKAVFAIVRVTDAEPHTRKLSYGTYEGQLATADVLEIIGDPLGNPVKIVQSLYGGCTNDEETNLLRVGGVYVLPLIYSDTDADRDVWVIYGDLDVLFEVDDKRLIHSHSKFPELNKYDGKELAFLWKDITNLYNNPLLRSHFAEHIGRGARVEIIGDTVRMRLGDHEWNDEDALGFSAKFDANGRLSVADWVNEGNFNVFSAVEGMTADEMNAAIRKIKQYVGIEDIETED
ncbi:hypothetical protein FACS1894208_06220 [Clostridia bacterium]|nr:hypothetical protein FACS1894208_06220 [Clostridia bacterium]